MLPDSVLSAGDKEFARSRGLALLSLEELSAGNWFPSLVTTTILTGANLPEGKELQPIASAVTNDTLAINNRSLCDLLAGSSGIFETFPSASIETLRSLARSLVDRAAVLAGIMTYLSVVTQLRAGERTALISLDSSMGRYFPGYFETMKTCIEAITLPGHEVATILVHPIQLPDGGDISVPLQGAALLLESAAA